MLVCVTIFLFAKTEEKDTRYTAAGIQNHSYHLKFEDDKNSKKTAEDHL